MSYLLDYNPGTQQWGYPRRGANLSGTCIVHTAECAMDLDGDDTSAEVCARFIANRADYGSYHRLVDSDSIIDMVPFEYEAWQDSETNPWGVGISAAVQAGRWLEIPADRRDRIYQNLAAAAAEFVRHMAGKGIEVPLSRITGAEARARVPGFCAHGDSGIARTDPGVQFDWALFFEYTRQALAGIATQGTITPVQEDDMDPNTIFTSKDGAQVSFNDFLNSIDAKIDGLPKLDGDLRGAFDTVTAFQRDVRADLAVKAQQIAALTAANGQLVSLLADSKSLSVEDIRTALASAIADGIKITVEAK
jgi:hypothetical protein